MDFALGFLIGLLIFFGVRYLLQAYRSRPNSSFGDGGGLVDTIGAQSRFISALLEICALPIGSPKLKRRLTDDGEVELVGPAPRGWPDEPADGSDLPSSGKISEIEGRLVWQQHLMTTRIVDASGTSSSASSIPTATELVQAVDDLGMFNFPPPPPLPTARPGYTTISEPIQHPEAATLTPMTPERRSALMPKSSDLSISLGDYCKAHHKRYWVDREDGTYCEICEVLRIAKIVPRPERRQEMIDAGLLPIPSAPNTPLADKDGRWPE